MSLIFFLLASTRNKGGVNQEEKASGKPSNHQARNKVEMPAFIEKWIHSETYELNIESAINLCCTTKLPVSFGIITSDVESVLYTININVNTQPEYISTKVARAKHCPHTLPLDLPFAAFHFSAPIKPLLVVEEYVSPFSKVSKNYFPIS